MPKIQRTFGHSKHIFLHMDNTPQSSPFHGSKMQFVPAFWAYNTKKSIYAQTSYLIGAKSWQTPTKTAFIFPPPYNPAQRAFFQAEGSKKCPHNKKKRQ